MLGQLLVSLAIQLELYCLVLRLYVVFFPLSERFIVFHGEPKATGGEPEGGSGGAHWDQPPAGEKSTHTQEGKQVAGADYPLLINLQLSTKMSLGDFPLSLSARSRKNILIKPFWKP